MFVRVKTTQSNSNYRSHNDSYARGILTDDQYEEGKKKSLISIQMCFWGWLYDFIPLFSQGLSTILREKYDLSFVHLPDAIVSFILIPFLHLMNDEETKLIILMAASENRANCLTMSHFLTANSCFSSILHWYKLKTKFN